MKLNITKTFFSQLAFYFLLITFYVSNLNAQEVTNPAVKSDEKSGIEKPNSIQATGDEINFKDESNNSLIKITDEGSVGSITIPSGSAPSPTTNKLYNESGTLKFNGSALGGGGASSINDLSDAIKDDFSLFIGTQSGSNDVVGPNKGNTAVGNLALAANISGTWNTALGWSALRSNTSGANTAIGYAALVDNVGGSSNTAVGSQALSYNTTGVNNVAVGNRALESNTDKGLNTALGTWALRDANANNNTAIGYHAMYQNTTGFSNTALGSNSLSSITIGKFNVALGSGTMINNLEGDYNTAVGYNAGYGSSGVSNSGNVFLGYQAGYSETGSNKLYIENSNSSTPLIWGDFANDIASINGKFGVGTQNPSDKVEIVAVTGTDALRVKIDTATKLRVLSNGGTTIGSNNTATTPANGLYVFGNILYDGTLTGPSDVRLKTNIKPIENALSKIKNLRGVYYYWKKEEFPERDFSKEKQIGVIAQEVENEFPEIVQTNADGYKSVDYPKLTVIFIEAIKEQEEKIEELIDQNTEIKNQLAIVGENSKVSDKELVFASEIEQIKNIKTENDNLKLKVEQLELVISRIISNENKTKLTVN
ncbi:MAG: tail fiber domain-containing protein [Melioribacteraceae bacterium]